MSVDVGFDFRSTSGYVTDPTNCYFVGGSDAYPTTYGTVSAGYSANAPGANVRDRSASVDARLAGIHFTTVGQPAPEFRIDLPNGTYNFYCALGDATSSYHANATLYDGPNTGAVLFSYGDLSVPAGSFVDATGATYTAAAWPASNSPLSITVTQGYVTFKNYAASALTVWAHARFTSASSGTTLTVASVTHGHADTAPSLSALYAVTPANVSQGHTDQNVNITQGVALAAQNVSQGHSDSSPTVSVLYSLTVQSLSHGHSDTSPSFGVTYALTPANVSHGHADSSPILTTGTFLPPANTSHGHADSSPTITQHSTLSISNIVHGQSVSNVTLTLPAHWTKGSGGAVVSWTQSSATSATWTKETTPSSSVWTH